MGHIMITYSDCDELKVAVARATGETTPELHAYHPRHSPKSECLSYLGSEPSVVAFELAVQLARRAAFASSHAGYEYDAADAVEEVRIFITQIGSPRTEAIGTDLLYYWPSVVMRES